MIKMLGALLLAAGGLWLGMLKSAGQYRRASALLQLSAAMEMMRGEISLNLTPVPELMELISRSFDGPVGIFFRNVSLLMPELGKETLAELWSRAVDGTADLPLSRAEMDELRLLGGALGRFGAGEQGRSLTLAADKFSGFASKAGEKAAQERKLCAGVGASAGLMLAIMLL